MNKNEHYLLTAIDNRYRLLIEDQERTYARSIAELKEGYNGILQLQESLILRQARHILALEARLQVEHEEEEQVLPRSSLQFGFVVSPPPPPSPPLSPRSSPPPPPVPEKHKDRPRCSLHYHDHPNHHQQQRQQHRTPEEVLDRSAKGQIAAWRRGRRDDSDRDGGDGDDGYDGDGGDGSDDGGDGDDSDDGDSDYDGGEWTESYDSDISTEEAIPDATGRGVAVVDGDDDSGSELTEGGKETLLQGWDSKGRDGRRLRGVSLCNPKQPQLRLSEGEKGQEEGKGKEGGKEKGKEKGKEEKGTEKEKAKAKEGPVAAMVRRIWARGAGKG